VALAGAYLGRRVILDGVGRYSMKRVAFLFPGQGSQQVGMGADLVMADARLSTLLDQWQSQLALMGTPSLRSVMLQGPEEQLRQTQYTQPALLACSLLCYEAFLTKTKGAVKAVATAGHSLGEFGALVASESLTAEQAMGLVAQRAQLMQEAPAGTMVAVLGLQAQQVRQVLEACSFNGDDFVVLANDNTVGQVVLSGTEGGMAVVTPALKEVGAKRVIALPVSGAFHSPFMQNAREEFALAIDAQLFSEPKIPVIANVSGLGNTTAEAIKRSLRQQMMSSVLWVDTMRTLVEIYEVDTIIEFGSGSVLSGLMKKAFSQVTSYQVSDVESLEATVQAVMAHSVAVC
jgi:[acyl-carrier-protein] S-malonyltransferase